MLALALAVACSDTTISTYNTAPTASITAPVEGSLFAPSDAIELRGVVGDEQQDATTLTVVWTSSLDGELGAGVTDADGRNLHTVTELTAGTHAVTLAVFDEEGRSADASVAFEVSFEAGNAGAPVVTIVSPGNGDLFGQQDLVQLVATATDGEQPWETLDATITSTVDGVLWRGNPATTGSVAQSLGPLSPGDHALYVDVEDTEGHVTSAFVNIAIERDAAPVATISSPADGAFFYSTETIGLEGLVTDDGPTLTEVAVSWESNLQGVLSTGHPDSSGVALANVALTPGVHTVTFSAWDPASNLSTDAISIQVVDPLQWDDDGDGFTESAGDCDDSHAQTYPGATEACDDKDNDCDTAVNEDFIDGFEPNDTTAYNLGSVDSGLWLGGSTAVAASLHVASDVDWFRFEGYDVFLVDNISIDATVNGLDPTGTWVMELWETDSAGNPRALKASHVGGAYLSISWSGDLWADDPEDYAVKLYSTSWPTTSGNACDTYTLTLDL